MFLPDFSSSLSVNSPYYRSVVLQFWSFLVKSDIPELDYSSELLNDKKVSVNFLFRTDGFISGLEELKVLNELYNELDFEFLVKDGEFITANSVFLSISGSYKLILSIERIILNFVTRMSSITTNCRRYTSLLSGFENKVEMLCTRKGLLGPIDKKAAVVAGVMSHRLNLSNGIMVKDNHYLSLDFDKFNDELLGKVEFIEFEVDNLEQLNLYFDRFLKVFARKSGGILLDNFSIEDLKDALKLLNKGDRNFFIEASGGINLKNLSGYDLKGLDCVSSSAIFDYDKSIDVAAEIVWS